MPTFDLRQSDNGVWYVHWTEGRRSKRVTTRQKDPAKAQTFLAHWILGEQQDKADGGASFTVAELWDEYFTKHVEKNNVTARPSEVAWKNLEPHFGPLKFAEFEIKNEFGDDKVEQYVKLRAAGEIGTCEAAPGTIRHEVAKLKACFSWCAKPKQKIIRPADIPVFDLPPDSEPRDRWLRREEIQKLVDAAAELRDGERLSRVERFLWLALETAARLTAILELTWDRVDFEAGVIHYDVPGRRKTKKRRASVPISNALRPILLRAYEERIGDLVMDLKSNSMWYFIQQTAERAKVLDVSPHVLRHTAATHMARRGVPLWKIAGVLGNSLAMVEKVYAKHCPDGLADAVELISNGSLEAAE